MTVPLSVPGFMYWNDPIMELVASLTRLQPGAMWCRYEYGPEGTTRTHFTVLATANDPGDTRVLLYDGYRAGNTATIRQIEDASRNRLVYQVTYCYVPDDQVERAFR